MVLRGVKNDQGAIRIEQAGVVRWIPQTRNRFRDLCALFAIGEHRIAFAKRAGGCKGVKDERCADNHEHGEANRPQRRLASVLFIWRR